MELAGVLSVRRQAGINETSKEGLDVGMEVFTEARQVINYREQRQLQIVGSAACVSERYEGSKEFLASQHQEIEAAHMKLSKARSEFEEHLKEIQAREQRIVNDEAR
jgi:glutamine amidotransferase-like uncharacterized protein